ncbi:hypothetical protein DMS64_25405 [Klebsiella variicola]|nr:hypothetical protein DMS64_25405 [Klebsiella variicola]
MHRISYDSSVTLFILHRSEKRFNRKFLEGRILSLSGATLVSLLTETKVCSYRVKFPGVAEIFYEHPPKRLQQAKAPEITPFTS